MNQVISAGIVKRRQMLSSGSSAPHVLEMGTRLLNGRMKLAFNAGPAVPGLEESPFGHKPHDF